MAVFVANTLWREVKKDAFFLGVGFALGCYATYQYIDKLEEKYVSTQSQPYGLERKLEE